MTAGQIVQRETAITGANLELILARGTLPAMPALKKGFCLVCRYEAGWGQGEKQVVCNGPLHLQLLNERYMRGEIMNVRWYQAPRLTADPSFN